MAMTKKEKEYVQELEREFRLLAALRWTQPVEPDLPIPRDGYTVGYVYNAHTGVVSEAWSGFVVHGVGSHDHTLRHSGRQRGIPLYSTRLLALKALRHETERQAATALAKIDKEIAENE